MPARNSRYILAQWLPALGIAGVMCYYALLLYRHALNVPYADDVYDVLHFLSNVVQSTNFTHTIKLFFEQWNEHRTLSSRLFYYLAFRIEGIVDFRTLIFLANLALPLMLVLLYIPIRRNPYALLILLSVALVLFQLRSYEVILSSMMAFAYMFVYVYAFASLLCLREASAMRFSASVVFATLGSFTLASGQLIWLVGFASLLQQSLILRRLSPVYAACWLVCAAIVLTVFHVGYVSQYTVAIMLGEFLASPLERTTFFLAILGSAVSSSNVLLAAGAGAIMFFTVAFSSVRNVTRDTVTLELFAWFLVISVFAMSLGRASLYEVEYALSSRYSFPSVLLLATMSVLVVSRFSAHREAPKIAALATLLALFYWICCFQTYPGALQGELEHRVKNYNGARFRVFGRSPEESQAVVRKAIALHIYRRPARPIPLPDVAPSPTSPKLASPLKGAHSATPTPSGTAVD